MEKNTLAFDTDPVNRTFAGYKEFNVKVLDILKGDDIDPRKFDDLLQEICDAPADAHVIVDNGAASFQAFNSYLKENDAVQLLQEQGNTVYFHTVITGGQAILDTVSGLKLLAANFLTAPIVVWLNHFFGEIEMEGKVFEQFKVYKDHQDQFDAIIDIPQGNAATLGKDLADLFAQRLSFTAGIHAAKSVAVQSRLNKYWKSVLMLVEQASFIHQNQK